MVQEDVDEYFSSKRDEIIGHIKDIIGVKSVTSCDDENDAEKVAKRDKGLEDVVDTAAALVQSIFGERATSYVLKNDSHRPGIVGRIKVDPSLPTVLLYAHLDVMPAPPEKWHLEEYGMKDPFDMQVVKDRIVGRGVSDDKGPFVVAMHGIKYLLEHDRLPVNIEFLCETGEESGSPGFDKLVEHAQQEGYLKNPSSILVGDTKFFGDTPTLTTTLRGIITARIELELHKKSLHSGLWGGVAVNPEEVINAAYATCKNPLTGEIMVYGFSDGTPRLEGELKNSLIATSEKFDLKKELDEGGVGESFTNQSFSALARMWMRPTLECHGTRPVNIGSAIPGAACMDITMRYVNGQDPTDMADKLQEKLQKYHPEIRVVYDPDEVAEAVTIDTSHPVFEKAAAAIEHAHGKRPVYAGIGGSIGSVGLFQKVFPDAPQVLMSHSLANDGHHGPNEKWDIVMAERWMKSVCHYLGSMGEKE